MITKILNRVHSLRYHRNKASCYKSHTINETIMRNKLNKSAQIVTTEGRGEIPLTINSESLGQINDTIEEKFQKEPFTAIILPTYCEAENIQNLIEEIQQLKLNIIIVIIDDSSPDGTGDIIRKLQLKYDNILLHIRSAKLGLGTAIAAGFRLILSLSKQPDYVITMDADYSHNPQDIRRLKCAAEDDYDLVIGSRYCQGGSIVGWHCARWLISHVANLIASRIVGIWIHDCTSGFRCYSMKYIKKVLPRLHSQTYEIQIETVKQAWAQGFRVTEVPITFVNRKRGKSKLTRTEIQSFLSYIIKTKLFHS